MTTYSYNRGSTYGESLNSPGEDGSSVIATGTGNPPIIYGDEEASAAGWTIHNAGPCYKREWPTDAVGGNLGTLRMWEDGVQIDDKGSVASCEANPGSFYCPDSTGNGGTLSTGGTATVYYHPTGSGNPTSNGKVTRIIARINGIVLGDNATIRGVEIRRFAQNNGPLDVQGTGVLIDGCLIDGDYKHGCVLGSGTIRNSVVYPGLRYSYPSELSNGQIGWYLFDPTGEETLIDKCVIAGSWTTATGSGPVTQHGDGANSYELATARGTAYLGQIAATIGNARNLVGNGIYAKRCTQSIPTGSFTDSFVCRNFILNDDNTDGSKSQSTLGGVRLYEDGCIYNNGGTGTLGIVTATNSAITFNNCIFFHSIDSALSRVLFQSGSSNSGRTVTLNRCLIVSNLGGGIGSHASGFTFEGSRNIILRYDHDSTFLPNNLSSSTNLIVTRTSGHGYANNSQMLALIDSVFNGDHAGVYDGDFTVSQSAIQAINSGLFPDGEPIANHFIGARTHWDFDNNAQAAGQPTAWPTIPTSYTEAQAFVLANEGMTWDAPRRQQSQPLGISLGIRL
jgi:hypothetical protein